MLGGPVAPEAATSGVPPKEDRPGLEYADSNRGLTVGLAGTCVAILTFALFFLYDRSQSGSFDPFLFRVTLDVIIGCLFMFAYSGTLFYWQMEALRRRDERAVVYEQWGAWLFVAGLLLLLAAPALILFTARLNDVGSMAFALWIGMLGILGWQEIRRARTEKRTRHPH